MPSILALCGYSMFAVAKGVLHDELLNFGSVDLLAAGYMGKRKGFVFFAGFMFAFGFTWNS